MKFLSQLFLVFFVFFQISSSVVYLIETEKETKITWLLDEDDFSSDESKELKEIKEVKEFKTDFLTSSNGHIFKVVACSIIEQNHLYLLKNYTSQTDLFLLPPEQV